MALDPSIFFQGAALRQANDARTQQTIQSVFDKLAARKQKEQELEQQKATDYEGSAYRVLMAQQAGAQPDPADLARAKAFDAMNTVQNAVDPVTGNIYAKNRSLFDGITATPQPAEAYTGFSPEDINTVMLAESGGDPNAVSPKGATGLMQLMPDTAKSPGYGVAPLKDGSPKENLRMGADYLNAMGKTYGDKATALMAYNWGPGNVDKWIAGGRDPNAVPAETRNYVSKILGSQAVNPMANTPAGKMKSFESDVALGQKTEEANIGAASKQAETLGAERGKQQAALEGKLAPIESMISELEAIGSETVAKMPGGLFEGLAATATNMADRPNAQALSQAKMDTLLPILMSKAKDMTRNSGEGTFTKDDYEQLQKMFFDKKDSTDVKVLKYNTILDAMYRARDNLKGEVTKREAANTGKPGFKYLGNE